ncbi:hypothetical protein COZ60_00135 [Candidatus Bathyarchaeota archaeon CG_4_8_14_3_um_filter_42_8]|nr:MAG: hypothetical protein COZ60_00135 [Candidatus Bathyarchaeota archaeon CG_4_8_14_3_um_filter_42_8]
MANGYANAWYINKTGTYTITLEFWPQKLFYIGCAISLTAFHACTAYLAYSYAKIKNTPNKTKQKLKHILGSKKRGLHQLHAHTQNHINTPNP